MNSPRDWGCSDPLAISQARLELQWPGHSLRLIDRVTLDNPRTALSQSRSFGRMRRGPAATEFAAIGAGLSAE